MKSSSIGKKNSKEQTRRSLFVSFSETKRYKKWRSSHFEFNVKKVIFKSFDARSPKEIQKEVTLALKRNKKTGLHNTNRLKATVLRLPRLHFRALVSFPFVPAYSKRHDQCEPARKLRHVRALLTGR